MYMMHLEKKNLLRTHLFLYVKLEHEDNIL